MKRILVFLTVLTGAACLAGNAVTVEPTPPTEYNAHWQIIQDGICGCVRDGLNVYGSNDSTHMRWTGQPINLGGYDGVCIRVSYSLKAADSNDYCNLYLGDYSYQLLHTFEDTGGDQDVFCTTLDDYIGVNDLKMNLVWFSDETGVDKGFRLYEIEIDGAKWGEGTYNNIFTWDASNDVSGHQTFDDTGMLPGYFNCLAFEYDTDLDTQGWWAVDNVDFKADGVSILPLQGGGYGVEDFENGGWQQYKHGLGGEWEIGTDHDAGGMSGANWQCDSAAHPGWHYQAETLSPWVYFSRTGTEATIEFDTWWSPKGTNESASFGYYANRGYPIFDYYFHNLDDWALDDDGDDVVETSWGEIKAGF